MLPPPSLQQQEWNQLWVSLDLFHMPSVGLSHTGLINHEPDPLRIILMAMFIVSSLQEIPSPHLSLPGLSLNFQGLQFHS